MTAIVTGMTGLLPSKIATKIRLLHDPHSFTESPKKPSAKEKRKLQNKKSNETKPVNLLPHNNRSKKQRQFSHGNALSQQIFK